LSSNFIDGQNTKLNDFLKNSYASVYHSSHYKTSLHDSYGFVDICRHMLCHVSIMFLKLNTKLSVSSGNV